MISARHSIRYCLVLALAGACLLLTRAWPAVAAPPAAQTLNYRGISPSDPGGRDGLSNPERGLRLATQDGEVGNLRPEKWLPPWPVQIQRYAPFGIKLIKVYIYLDEFVGKPLSNEKLKAIQDTFDRLRARGVKALLRFAYEHPTVAALASRPMARGPSFDDIHRHLMQLTPLLQQNADVIFVLQAGFVGSWGEWHHSLEHLERDHLGLAGVIWHMLQAMPSESMLQMRYPRFKRWVLQAKGVMQILDAQLAYRGSPAARIGFYDDGFMAGTTDGGTFQEGPHFANPGNPDFDYMTAESPYVPIDGELYYQEQAADAFQAILRMRLHHYTSFSLVHAYSAYEGGRPAAIDKWMGTPLTLQQVQEARLPVSDGYFHTASGTEVTRSAFEYIRDHLGYRIELQNATFPRQAAPGQSFLIRTRLINRGFAAPCNPRPVSFVLLADDGRVYCLGEASVDPRGWQPFVPNDPLYTPLVHRLEVTVTIPAKVPAGSYWIGLWLPDAHPSLRLDARYALRVANGNVDWWIDEQSRYGVNVLGALDISTVSGS